MTPYTPAERAIIETAKAIYESSRLGKTWNELVVITEVSHLYSDLKKGDITGEKFLRLVTPLVS